MPGAQLDCKLLGILDREIAAYLPAPANGLPPEDWLRQHHVVEHDVQPSEGVRTSLVAAQRDDRRVCVPVEGGVRVGEVGRSPAP